MCIIILSSSASIRRSSDYVVDTGMDRWIGLLDAKKSTLLCRDPYYGSQVLVPGRENKKNGCELLKMSVTNNCRSR